MNEGHYDTLKRVASVLVAVCLWFLSVQFSVAGFSIQVPNLVWAGWVLGFAVTVIELIFTSQNRGRNMTLTLLGIIAYAYGVWSNVAGIYTSREGESGVIVTTSLIFSIILGLVLEISPEPLFLWGILGSETGEGDVVNTVSNLFKGFRAPVKRGRPKKVEFPTETDMPTDTVSNTPRGPNYMMLSRLNITSKLASGGRLYWDKTKSQSPVLVANGTRINISRSLIRQMVDEKTLIEKKSGDMMIEYVLSGAEPPVLPPAFK